MPETKKHPGTAVCPNCRSLSEPREWKAPVGLDPDMRKFTCFLCGEEFYIVVHNQRRLVAIDDRIVELSQLPEKQARLSGP